MAAVPVTPSPSSRDGFYAINNPFLLSGPKGFSESKMLENEDMFVRIDLPGVSKECVTVDLHPLEKAVIISAKASKVHEHDSSYRLYLTTTGLICRCCKISSFTSHMSNGALRLVLSKTRSYPRRSSNIAFLHPEYSEDLRVEGPHEFPHGTDPQDPALTGPVLQPHPMVLQGSQSAYESKQLGNGKLYVRVDMPGVPEDSFTVSVTNGVVHVTGGAPAVSHDSSGRSYSGAVARLSRPVDIPIRRIKTIAKDGVIRLLIPRVG